MISCSEVRTVEGALRKARSSNRVQKFTDDGFRYTPFFAFVSVFDGSSSSARIESSLKA